MNFILNIQFFGGRGAVSSSGNSHFKFKGSGHSSNTDFMYPAIANNRIKIKNVETAMKDFKSNYLNADIEYAYSIDEYGFVHLYGKGRSHAVEVPKVKETKNMTVIHNHPNGSAFSKQDMFTFSNRDDIKSLVASGKNYDYVIKKGTHFDKDKFKKARYFKS